MEWLEMMEAALLALSTEMRPSMLMTAFTVGMEVAYKLGCSEILRYTPGRKGPQQALKLLKKSLK